MIEKSLPLILAGLLVAVGCRNPSPAVVFHTLSPLALKAESTAGTAPAIEVMPVQLPELLQRSQIVVRNGEGSHWLSGTHRWGNTLEKDMQRVLTENLADLLGSPVVPYPQGERIKAPYRIALEVSQCDGGLGGVLRFRGNWTVVQRDSGRTVLHHRVLWQEPVSGRDFQDLVHAHDRLLERLSREIAQALKTIEGGWS